jgi:phage baseplate assembly protein gpV
VTQRAGLQVGDVDNVPGFGGQQNTQISQDNVSDWDFLSRLAAAVGAQVAVLDGKLSFKLPAPPASAPADSAKATANPLVLEAHRTLVSLRAQVTAAEQVPQVEVRGWDFANKQAVSATATPTIAGTEIQGSDPVQFANAFGSPNFVATDVPYRVQAEVQAGADALAAQLGGACAELDGVAKGNPKLRAGTPVTLVNVGDAFAGKYTLTGTRHLFSDQVGYTTAFTVSGRQERSLYGLATGGTGGGTAGARRIQGLVIGIVSDVKDPLNLGRVRLQFPWLAKDFVSGWARVVQTGAGPSRGFYVLPEVNDEVMVGFELGDFDSPYVIGGLWNNVDKPPHLSTDVVDGSSGEIKARAFVSRKGHKIEFVEDTGITLTSGDGSVTIALDATNQNVQITSNKTISLKAANGLSLDAGTGTLEFKGQKLSLTSMTDYELHATGQLKLSGDAGVTMEGPTISITGQGETQVTSNGPLTIRGTPVAIN